jgi:DNA repair protein RadB
MENNVENNPVVYGGQSETKNIKSNDSFEMLKPNTAKISTGSELLDSYLGGGYESDIVTTIYGPSGSGKTNLCLLAATKVAESGKKVIVIDTEGGIAVERIKQLTPRWENVLSKFLFFQPLNFDQQQDVFGKLKKILDGVGLIVVDSISMLYRLELGKAEAIFETNSALARQIATLVEISRSNNIPVLITNQVYADFNNKDKVKMVGGDLLKYGSKCLVELFKLGEKDNRALVIRKHRYLPGGKEVLFRIVNEGVLGI